MCYPNKPCASAIVIEPYEDYLHKKNFHKKIITTLSSDMVNLLMHSPGFIAWKDTNLAYMGCNANTMKGAGLNSVKHMIGKRDVELVFGEKFDQVCYNQQEKEVLSGNMLISLGVTQHNDKFRTMLSRSFPLLDKGGNIIGLMDYYTEIENPTLANIIQSVSNLGVKITSKILNEAKKFTLLSEIRLSKRQEECLYYLLRGFSAKEIAKALCLSHRTVEFYIDNMKDKFKCLDKTTLIIKAIKLGCLEMVPENVFLKNLNKRS